MSEKTDRVMVIGSTEDRVFMHEARRPPCPFYGFIGIAGIFVDYRGDSCGLAGGHRPCSMELQGRRPDWNACTRFNNDENRDYLESILDNGRIFPNELLPEIASKWDGVSLRDWFRLIIRA